MHAAASGCIKDLPREFYHDPTITENDGWTVAMIAARNNHINDLTKEFYHAPTFKNNYGYTVNDILV